MAEKITIKSVAKLAGVSIGTVSNVLNGTGRVSLGTIRKVRRVMKELNYYPNSSARNLRAHKSHMIALIVPFLDKTNLFDSPFYWQLVTGIEAGARNHDLHVLFAGFEEDQNMSFVRDRNLDGVIVVGTNNESPIVTQLRSFNIPCVFLDSYLSDPDVYQVHLDDEMGGYLGTNHLISLGHRYIVLLTSTLQQDTVNYKRWLGYKKALEEHGIDYNPNLVLENNLNFEGGYFSAQQVFQNKHEVSAVFTLSDTAAIGLMKGLSELGLSVPKDMSIMGFDDIRYTEYTTPTLTTVNQNIVQKGQKAVSLLLDQIEGIQHAQKTAILPVTLKVRQSTVQKA